MNFFYASNIFNVQAYVETNRILLLSEVCFEWLSKIITINVCHIQVERDAIKSIDGSQTLPGNTYCMTTYQPLYCCRDSVDGLKSFLLDQTRAGGDRQVLQYVTDLLTKNVGFLLNERYVNIPAQVTVPLLETLVTEMRKATDRNLPFNFSHYIMISKLFKTKTDSPHDQQVSQITTTT